MFYESVDAAIVGILKDTGAHGSDVYLDNAPVDAIPPYCTYNGNISTAPSVHGDGKIQQYNRQAQIDYWDTVDGEDPSRVTTIREGLNGIRFYLTGNKRCKLKVLSVTRIPEPQGDNLTHYSFTVEVQHGMQAG